MGSEVRTVLASLVLIAGVTYVGNAMAYCRTTQCGDGLEGAACFPESTRPDQNPPPDCGTPIYWGRDCMGFAVHASGSSQHDADTAAILLQEAFSTWQNADCGGGSTPSVHLAYLGQVSCGAVEYNSTGGNVSVLSFREDVWPHVERGNALALTTVTYDLDTGEIYDADIEVNLVNRVLSTTDTTNTWDLRSVLTHEAGHFLGLSHSDYEVAGDKATMSVDVEPGITDYRTLSPDDIAGVCELFPPSASPPDDTCNPIPRHGFSSECLDNQTHGDCSAAHHRPTHRPALWLVAGALLCLRRRRR